MNSRGNVIHSLSADDGQSSISQQGQELSLLPNQTWRFVQNVGAYDIESYTIFLGISLHEISDVPVTPATRVSFTLQKVAM